MSTMMTKLAAAPFLLKLVAGYIAGYEPINDSLLLSLLAWAYAFSKAKNDHRALAVALACFPKFRLGLGREDANEISPLEHLFRLVAFRKVDLKLAPAVPLYQLLTIGVKHGLWNRHLSEREFTKRLGESLAFYIPLQRYDVTKPATLVYAITNPEDVEMVLADKETFPTRGFTGFTDIVGEGLLGLPSGEMHSSHRALVINFLSDKHLRNYAHFVTDQVEIMLNKWGCGLTQPKGTKTTVNAQYDLSMLTLDIIMVTAFGAKKQYWSQHIPEKDNHLAHALDVVLKDIVVRTVIPGYALIPTPLQFYINRMIKEANELQAELYADCKKRIEEEPDAPSTMLSEMLKAGLPDSEVANELQTIRGAGHETTSNTLCWAMLLLARNPDKLAKLQEEVDQLVKGDACTFDESKQLKYCSQVIFETLRLYPTVPHFPRECHKDMRLKSNGYDLMAGSLVFVSQSSMNRAKSQWGDNAEEFVPERFNGVGELRMGVPVGIPGGPKYGFAPFGAANRSCVGQRLAILEANQILSTLVKRCTWKLSNPDKEIAQVADVTLGPKMGLIFDMTPRTVA